jgi:hypothetical protein
VVAEQACAGQIGGDCGCGQAHGGRGEPPPAFSLTLIRRVAAVGVPDYSSHPGDLRPALFPATLTLTTLARCAFPTPVDYLRAAEAALAPGLPGHRVDFYREREVRGHPAACAQSRFFSHFELLRLSIVWESGPLLLVAALLTDAGWGAGGWQALEGFAESVRYPPAEGAAPA